MKPISHIVVVVDPTASGPQSSVEKAGLLAHCLNAKVELLICDIESALNDRAVSLLPHEVPFSNTQMLDRLDTLAAPLRVQGTEATIRVIYGKSLHDSILEYLRDANADLVVKETHQHSITKQTLLRNTDWHLMRECPTPLLLTKKRAWGKPPVIMAAIDPNQASEHATALDRDILSGAASLAERLGADLHVIHTFIPAALAAVVAAGGRVTTRGCSEAVEIENSFRNSQLERLVSTYGVTRAHLHVEMGTPEDCLIDTVTRYHTDVMVMGSPSHGSWRRMVVGSTAATIMESLSCDFLIVRPTKDA